MSRDLVKKGFYSSFLSISVPLMLQSLLNALVGISDALMLGRLSQEAIAAVSLANQIFFVMSLFAGAFLGAAGTLIAQYYGKGDLKNAQRFMSMTLRYVTGVAAIFSLLTRLCPEVLMSLYTDTPEMIEIGASYLRIVGISYIFSAVSQCYLMVMKICGRARLSVYISIMVVSVDMLVDFFLIYGIWGAPALGANGSAYSTIAVELLALIWCLVDSLQKDHIHPTVESLTFFSGAFEKDLWKIVLPMFASSLSWGIGFSLRSLAMGHLGTDAAAAYSVSSVTQQLVQCIGQGAASGAVIMIGGLLGQNQLEEAKEYGSCFWKVAFGVAVINVGLVALVGPAAVCFFVLEETAKAYLIRMLFVTAAYMVAFSFNAIITCGVFIAGGDFTYDAISVLLASWCFAIPLSLLGTFVFHWPVMVVFLFISADEIVKVPFIWPRYKKYIWVKNLTREESAS